MLDDDDDDGKIAKYDGASSIPLPFIIKKEFVNFCVIPFSVSVRIEWVE